MMKMVGTKEAAEVLGVDPSRVRQRILSGDIKAQRIGRDWLIDEHELERAKASTNSRGRPRVIATEGQVKRSELARATHDWVPGSAGADGTPYVAPCILLGHTDGGRVRIEVWRVAGGTEVRYVDADRIRERE